MMAMSTFSYTASRGRSRAVALTWTNGVVSGDDAELVAQVEQLAHDFEGALLGPPNGPYTTEQHLSSPYTARMLMLMLMVLRYKATVTTGALPRQADAPAGAIH